MTTKPDVSLQQLCSVSLDQLNQGHYKLPGAGPQDQPGLVVPQGNSPPDRMPMSLFQSTPHSTAHSSTAQGQPMPFSSNPQAPLQPAMRFNQPNQSNQSNQPNQPNQPNQSAWPQSGQPLAHVHPQGGAANAGTFLGGQINMTAPSQTSNMAPVTLNPALPQPVPRRPSAPTDNTANAQTGSVAHTGNASPNVSMPSAINPVRLAQAVAAAQAHSALPQNTRNPSMAAASPQGQPQPASTGPSARLPAALSALSALSSQRTAQQGSAPKHTTPHAQAQAAVTAAASAAAFRIAAEGMGLFKLPLLPGLKPLQGLSALQASQAAANLAAPAAAGAAVTPTFSSTTTTTTATTTPTAMTTTTLVPVSTTTTTTTTTTSTTTSTGLASAAATNAAATAALAAANALLANSTTRRPNGALDLASLAGLAGLAEWSGGRLGAAQLAQMQALAGWMRRAAAPAPASQQLATTPAATEGDKKGTKDKAAPVNSKGAQLSAALAAALQAADTRDVHVCRECGKSFSSASFLNNHLKRHAKPMECECGKRFDNTLSLVRHQRTHVPLALRPKLPCPICGKVFLSKETLVQHRKTHVHEPDFKCDVCQRSFTQKASLVRHQRIHTGEKPYACAQCGKRFIQPAGLRYHAATKHPGTKSPLPYKALTKLPCAVCGKSFVSPSALAGHQRTHTGEKPFKCPLSTCSACFSHKSNCKAHVRRKHPDYKGKVLFIDTQASGTNGRKARSSFSASGLLNAPTTSASAAAAAAVAAAAAAAAAAGGARTIAGDGAGGATLPLPKNLKPSVKAALESPSRAVLPKGGKSFPTPREGAVGAVAAAVAAAAAAAAAASAANGAFVRAPRSLKASPRTPISSNAAAIAAAIQAATAAKTASAVAAAIKAAAAAAVAAGAVRGTGTPAAITNATTAATAALIAADASRRKRTTPERAAGAQGAAEGLHKKRRLAQKAGEGENEQSMSAQTAPLPTSTATAASSPLVSAVAAAKESAATAALRQLQAACTNNLLPANTTIPPPTKPQGDG